MTMVLEIILVITSLLRQRLGVRTFRVIHWTTYLLWPIAMAHALGNGTDTGHIWFMAFAGVCALLVIVAVVFRLRSNFTEYADA